MSQNKTILLTLLLWVLTLASCKSPKIAEQETQARLNQIYPGQFTAYDSSTTFLKVNLKFSRFYVWVRSNQNEHFRTKLLWDIKKPAGGLKDLDIKKKLSRSYWALAHSERLAGQLAAVLTDFSLYVRPQVAEWKTLPTDIAFNQSWEKVSPNAHMNITLYLYREVSESNRKSIAADLARVRAFFTKNSGAKSRLSLLFFSPDVRRKYGKLIYPYLSYKSGKWAGNNRTFYLNSKLANFPDNIWEGLSISNQTNSGRKFSRLIRKRAGEIGEKYGKHLIKTRFVKMSLDPQNLDVIDFKVHVCRVKFEKKCPRKERMFWSGQFIRKSQLVTFRK